MAEVEEVDVVDTSGEDAILAFDGRVFEVFQNFKEQVAGGGYQHADAWRVHVRQLTVKVSGPDRDGHRVAIFFGPSERKLKKKSGFFEYKPLDEAQWSRLEPLLDALKAAGANFET